MDRKIFNEILKKTDFSTLFIEHLGWDRPSSHNSLEIECLELKFEFKEAAQKNGFRIYFGAVAEIPKSSFLKIIDSKIRKYSNDYIIIFYIENEHQLWLAPVKTIEKRALVTIEYESADKADFLFNKLQGLSFDLLEEVTIVDVTNRIYKTFEVNSARVTTDFYRGFKQQHDNFLKFITGISNADDKKWFASVMLNRLMFCYFIQKKNFLNFDTDYLNTKLKMVKKERGKDEFYGSFYKKFLEHLFHDGLNSPARDKNFERTFGKIPYLNGGLFDEHSLEKTYKNIDIKDLAFESLFAFFDKWHWHLDSRITASGMDINPDVLGYIFEQYINDRSSMGAYYTKEDITEYIGKNCILPFLFEKAEIKIEKLTTKLSDKYIYLAIKKGVEKKLPQEISKGISNVAEREEWNKTASKEYALPTEIWREVVERRKYYEDVKEKIDDGKIKTINDFITYNLDIRSFTEDVLREANKDLVKKFYFSLQNVTILDPTCGSGAFLFAALNILEPLYEICIERMREFNEKNGELFKMELDEITNKYRSNIQYFVYKSIILKNLYGVDIMHEATEIAKLRLFLKMVAVIEADENATNLGLDPLPDIDFNIKCGNSLVGFALENDLDTAMRESTIGYSEDDRKEIIEKCESVAIKYDLYKEVQLSEGDNAETTKKAKEELRDKLTKVNDKLNDVLESLQGPQKQAFHWFAEFYEIIMKNGGFDVVIGNPPYVEYTKKDKVTKKSVKDMYQLFNYTTISCNNLYGFIIERSTKIIKDSSYFGMIVPISSISTPAFCEIQNIFRDRTTWISNYAATSDPGVLFIGVKLQLTIFITKKDENKLLYTTNYLKWFIEERSTLFEKLQYIEISKISKSNEILKIGNEIEIDIVKRINDVNKFIFNYFSGNSKIYFKKYGNYFWKMFIDYIPFFDDGEKTRSGSVTEISVEKKSLYEIISVLNSDIFYHFYLISSDCRNISLRDISKFKYNSLIENTDILKNLGKKLCRDVKSKSRIRIENLTNGSVRKVEIFDRFKESKPIINEIDKILAENYKFTDKELDFIINYDIKYRMGGEFIGNFVLPI
jgi:hypothetical protein